MRRFFVSPAELREDMIPLPEEVLHHCRKVLRLKTGDEILLLDGSGKICRCRIEALDKKEGRASVLERRMEEETAFSVHLLQALPKGEKIDFVLQKGTELGVGRFSPIMSERSVPELDDRRAHRRMERWHRIVSEAARQCGRPILPRISPPLEMEGALGRCEEELRLMLWEEESLPIIEVLPRTPPRDAALLVGPEGGFSRREMEIARKAGFLPVRLGPRILRSETVCLAAAGLLQFFYGDLGPAAQKFIDAPHQLRKESP